MRRPVLVVLSSLALSGLATAELPDPGVNFRFTANDVSSRSEAVESMEQAAKK